MVSLQAGPGTDPAGSCGHEGEDRPRLTAPGAADVPEVLPRPASGQLPAVCSEGGGGGGEEGEHGSGPGVPHVPQVRTSGSSRQLPGYVVTIAHLMSAYYVPSIIYWSLSIIGPSELQHM